MGPDMNLMKKIYREGRIGHLFGDKITEHRLRQRASGLTYRERGVNVDPYPKASLQLTY
jgi:hypothetical protein